jgi:hypothetical protein
VKVSAPYSSWARTYSSSVSSWRLERGQARLKHDIGFEVEDALEILERHIHQEADARGQRLQEPDMRDGSGELDMAHALAPDAGERDFDAALLADHALELHALVLAAQALVVLDRPEDAGAEQAVALRLERAVVDRLGLLDLAERPGAIFSGLAIEILIASNACCTGCWPKRFMTSCFIACLL